MNAPDNLPKTERLRLRDGDRCWLCNGVLDFGAVPNSNKAPTIEHLVAEANGGTNVLDNLVLTHPGCNKQLGARPIEDKRRLRAKYRSAREWTHAAREVRASTPSEEGGQKKVERSASLPSDGRRPPTRPALQQWQAGVVAAAGTALLAIGFAAGTAFAH